MHTFIENIDFIMYATGHRLLETEILIFSQHLVSHFRFILQSRSFIIHDFSPGLLQ